MEEVPRGAVAEPGRSSSARVSEPVREVMNLRVVLELRRRLKGAAEKELAVGADRLRSLRAEVRRAEGELRLCARLLQVRAGQLAESAERAEQAQARAVQTRGRLASLDRENRDLAQQLQRARANADRLELSPDAAQQGRHGTLEVFVSATAALLTELEVAARDHDSLHARMCDQMEECELLAARASALWSCHQALRQAMADLHEGVFDALAGGMVAETIPRGLLSAPTGEGSGTL